MNNANRKIRISIGQADYARLLRVAEKGEAECFTDYYFDTEGLLFARSESALRIRENGNTYELMLSLATKNADDEIAIAEFSKRITAKDFTHSVIRWLPRDLIEEYPISWIHNPLEHKSIGYFECTDTEQRRLAIGRKLFAVLKEIDYMNLATRYEIVFVPKTEKEKTAFEAFLTKQGIKAIVPKNSEYETLATVWRKSFLSKDENLLDSISISFRGSGIKHITQRERWDIFIKSKEGRYLSSAIVKYIEDTESSPEAIVWKEPFEYRERAKYVVKNLREALKKIEASDEYNGRQWGEDDAEYKFYGLTQKEYIAIKQAELKLFSVVTVGLSDEESTLLSEIYDGVDPKESANKYYGGDEKKRNNRIFALYGKLAKEYKRADIEDVGKFPPFEALSPLQQEFLQAAFNLYVYFDDEEFSRYDSKGANKYWEMQYPDRLTAMTEEERIKLWELHERLFGRGRG